MNPTDTRTPRPPRSRTRPPTAVHRRASGARRPPIDPRMRQRRTAVARRQGRRRLTVVLALAVAVVVALAAVELLHSTLLSARDLTVEGSVHTPAPVVLATAGLADHPPLVDVDPGAAAQRIERLPWVASARVQVGWPDAVHVEVVERTPAATMAVRHGVVLVDATGRVLATEATAPGGLPAVVAPGPVPGPGAAVGPSTVPALEAAASLPPAFRAQVRQVTLDRSGLHLILTSPITVTVGSLAQLAKKWEDVAAVLAGATLHPGDVVDVSAPGSPTVSGP